MKTMHDRLEQAVDRSGRSRRDISLAAGLAAGTLNDILKNRGRSPSVANIEALARVLNVTTAWLVCGNGDNGPPGLSDGELAPFIPKPARAGAGGDPQIAQVLAPRARSPAVMKINTATAFLGYLAGDVVVVDLGATAKVGDLVVAQVQDLVSGEATTHLRRFLPPYLVPGDAAGETFMADGVRTSIMGSVVASFRAPQITGD